MFCAEIFVVLSGCGYDPETPVYDTTKNPDKFPSPALSLLDGVRSGSLDSYDTVVASFGNLYTGNPELLDDYRWRKVIERLGVQFKFKAEQAAEAGIVGFARAAQFYGLASMARPHDERLRNRQELFAGWIQAISDSIIPGDFDPEKVKLSEADELALLKYFVLGDTLHREFARQYLIPELLVINPLDKPASTENISSADRLFRVLLGLKQESPHGRIGVFSDPPIDLVAAQITRQSGDWCAAEFYFVPHESLTVNYTVAFRIQAADSSAKGGTLADSQDLVFDFRPVVPTSRWKSGEPAGVYRRFRYAGPAVELQLGLYERGADSAHFVRVLETGERFLTLPTSTFQSK
ncbi:MAG: hypothetical protein AB1644_05210 [Candidatus Zixiibacteriota bacterium]